MGLWPDTYKDISILILEETPVFPMGEYLWRPSFLQSSELRSAIFQPEKLRIWILSKHSDMSNRRLASNSNDATQGIPRADGFRLVCYY
jgi:hypothetical protein